jgi:hypothetical protein
MQGECLRDSFPSVPQTNNLKALFSFTYMLFDHHTYYTASLHTYYAASISHAGVSITTNSAPWFSSLPFRRDPKSGRGRGTVAAAACCQ